MIAYKYMIVISHRELMEQYLDFFRENKIERVITKLCDGTSTDGMLNLLGLEKTEKAMFEALVRNKDILEIKRGLLNKMNMGGAGNGIAIFLPLESMGGESSLRYFIGDSEIEKTEERQMENKFSLIITIVDKGNSEEVMEAARSAGATGGTIVKAKGTGAQIAKFFGVSMSEEKDMVYIISLTEAKDAIMRAIMEKAGSSTPAHGIVFSMPVDDLMGIRQFEELKENN